MPDAAEAAPSERRYWRVQTLRHERVQRRVLAWLGATAAVGVGVLLMFAAVGVFGATIALLASLFAVPILGREFADEQERVDSEIYVENGVLHVPALGRAFGEVRAGIESVVDGSVVLDLPRGDALRLRFPKGDEGAVALLEALGVGSGQRTARVPLRRFYGKLGLGVLAFGASLLPALKLAALASAYFGPPVPSLVMLAFASLVTGVVLWRFGNPHLVIGSDGVRVRGMIRQPFFRYAQLRRARLEASDQLALDLVDGSRQTLPVAGVDVDRVRGLVDRIERARMRGSEPRAYLAESLRRGGRSDGEWQASLERLAKREVGFREIALDADEVERIVSDAGAKAEERVGAAYVLTRIDASAAARVRVAAESTVEEGLREDLLAVAEGRFARR